MFLRKQGNTWHTCHFHTVNLDTFISSQFSLLAYFQIQAADEYNVDTIHFENCKNKNSPEIGGSYHKLMIISNDMNMSHLSHKIFILRVIKFKVHLVNVTNYRRFYNLIQIVCNVSVN